jgi:TM2 domain-containing membrane protein YozV
VFLSDRERYLEKGTMNNSLKGAFLSGLVFPGLGQIVLKQYKRGAVIMLTVLVSLSVIVIEAVQKAFTILEKIESKGGAIDMNTISNAATQASTTSDSLIFSFALLLIIFCWIIGVVDAFRIGKKKDIEQQSTNQVSNSKGN